MAVQDGSLTSRCLAEVLGTFLLIFFGLGAVHAAILTGALSGLWQVAIVWGIAIMLAIYVVGAISGAHINPAISVAFATWGRLRWGDVPFYVLSQLAGAFVAAAVLFLLFGPFLADKEKDLQVERGQPGSEITAMCYGEYFPNPGRLAGGPGAYRPAEHERINALVSEPAAFVAELLGTLVLALVVFTVTDERSSVAPGKQLAPVFIGLTVSALIVVIGPLTQACFNPARDFGPRLFACLAGWGRIALPGRGTGFLTVYILAPTLGAILGGGLHRFFLHPHFAPDTPAEVGPHASPKT